jgi:hypothetical protein
MAEAVAPSIRDPLVALDPLELNALPSHPSLPDVSSSSHIPLESFIKKALSEATAKIASFSSWENAEHKSSSPATAKVAVKVFDKWAVRRSVHKDAAESGTGSWEEFHHGLVTDGHAENEGKFTPNIQFVQKVLEWDVPDTLPEVEGWRDFRLNGKTPALLVYRISR